MKGLRQLVCGGLCLLLLAGCAGPQPLYSQVEVDRLRADTQYLAGEIGIRPAGSEKELEAGDWIIRRLEEYGFAGTEQQAFVGDTTEPFASRNIVATCNSGAGGPVIDIVAHYDSVPTSPGARDNAASVAALLEIARILGEENAAVPCEVRLVFLGGEEVGYWGSAAYLQSLPEAELPRHIAAFNMDIAAASLGTPAFLTCNTLGGLTPDGYRDGDFFTPAHNRVSRAVADACGALYPQLDTRFIPYYYGESDHLNFHLAGIDAANVCWREERSGETVLPAQYHQMTDTADTIDYQSVEIIVQCILYGVQQLALEDTPG